jgi:hypothetical protein
MGTLGSLWDWSERNQQMGIVDTLLGHARADMHQTRLQAFTALARTGDPRAGTRLAAAAQSDPLGLVKSKARFLRDGQRSKSGSVGSLADVRKSLEEIRDENTKLKKDLAELKNRVDTPQS